MPSIHYNRSPAILNFVLCATSTPKPSTKPFSQTDVHKSPLYHQLQKSLVVWQHLTNTSSYEVPNDLQVRRCPIAQSLRLSSLISRAGGYQYVRKQLGLIPSTTIRQNSRQRELKQLAVSLQHLCKRLSLPSPYVSFPTRQCIRLNDPTLANRIEAFPSRAGYIALESQFRSPSYLHSQASLSTLRTHPFKSSSKRSKWGYWVNFDRLMIELAPFQSHPRVMPPLNRLPNQLVSAIQRQGGSQLVAQRAKFVRYKNYQGSLRLTTIVQWLAQHACRTLPFSEVNPNPTAYLNFVRFQSESPPSFPSSQEIPHAILKDIQGLGGKKVWALRLGYAREDAIPGLFMGTFSVQLASDLLLYATNSAFAAHDGCLAMPTMNALKETPHLLTAVQFFGGEVTIGRRLGLIPLFSEQLHQ